MVGKCRIFGLFPPLMIDGGSQLKYPEFSGLSVRENEERIIE